MSPNGDVVLPTWSWLLGACAIIAFMLLSPFYNVKMLIRCFLGRIWTWAGVRALGMMICFVVSIMMLIFMFWDKRVWTQENWISWSELMWPWWLPFLYAYKLTLNLWEAMMLATIGKGINEQVQEIQDSSKGFWDITKIDIKDMDGELYGRIYELSSQGDQELHESNGV